MTAAELEALAAMYAAATPGPWSVCPMNEYVFAADGHMVSDQGDHDEDAPAGLVQRIRGYGAEKSGRRPEGAQDANIALIVAAVNALPKLIESARLLREVITAHDTIMHGDDSQSFARSARYANALQAARKLTQAKP